ncbi:MAG: mechanosensitive ion channel family protein [Oscillatoriales cyanobacterium RM2_1_1]|nr:mechanosensitive ion channel family protein [Oscillatoriales cyanobacterium SM2_3_0]NJO47462.1 mechanosensitive ion channel family protein [Oscillatoriales cyanobacterium RM2_1_1]
MVPLSERHFAFIPKRFRLGLVLCVVVFSVILQVTSLQAQVNTSAENLNLALGDQSALISQSRPQPGDTQIEGNKIDGFPVVLDGRTLFRVREGMPGIASASERADILNERLKEIARDSTVTADSIQVVEQDNLSVVQAGGEVLFTIREEDRFGNRSRQQTAEKAAQIIQSAIAQYREERSTKQLIIGIVWATLGTLGFILFVGLLQRIISKALIRVRAARRVDALDLNYHGSQLLDSKAVSYLLEGLIKLLRVGIILGAIFLYIPFFLSQFPITRSLGNSVFNDIGQKVEDLVTSFVHYIPSLAIILIIGFVTYYVIGFANLVILELGRSNIYPWFYPEWIQPTKRLTAFIIVAIACIVASSYIPGINSPAFQGISIFLGALLTIGSSSAVSNTISGIILIYTRSFQLGDYIRIGEIVGEVREKSLFVTRIITPKKEVITIPNTAVLNSNVVNYSVISRESTSHLLLHTTVTLGYDLPWKKVHETLVKAALATSSILSDPEPFVLQTGLNDFNVSYELNAYTDLPILMPRIYSELHQNIQDYCNRVGIEILSPHFSALRDGNHSTIPADYLPEDYVSSGFQIDNSKP